MKLVGDYDLRELHRRVREANNITQFCEFMRQLDMEKLSDAYEEEKAHAPRPKQYFVGRAGKPTTSSEESNRREEHLAMALCNDFGEKGEVAHEEISELRFLDYQFPLKARRGDAGVGKVDLFGVIDDVHPCVVELKIDRESGLGDTPARALLEALAYCAIVEANIEQIAGEARETFGVNFSAKKPRLMILAPGSYWRGWKDKREAKDWRPVFLDLLKSIREHIGLHCHLAALHGCGLSMGDNNTKPGLRGAKCKLTSVRLDA
ncbi:MAG: hypothetical protein MPK31_08680 [Gammaproteobacteria bacterium]|nr:hypothetical protein [Gammaproteobacteria bacterium]